MKHTAENVVIGLFLILAIVLLLSGCSALDHRNRPPVAGPGFPVQPQTPPAAPDMVTIPIPPSHPIHGELASSLQENRERI